MRNTQCILCGQGLAETEDAVHNRCLPKLEHLPERERRWMEQAIDDQCVPSTDSRSDTLPF
jgi:hypothetical protein